jgi:hypothetical protein
LRAVINCALLLPLMFAGRSMMRLGIRLRFKYEFSTLRMILRRWQTETAHENISDMHRHQLGDVHNCNTRNASAAES